MANRKFSPAQLNYMEAMALYQTISGIEEECKIKVLAENVFYTAPEWGENRRITSPKSDYLMTDTDSETYFNLTFIEYQKRGIAPKDCHTVASWEAQKAFMQAERELIEWGYSIMRILPEWKKVGKELEAFKDVLDYHLEIRKQVIDLTMKLQAQEVAI
jgi:hypothetical protein